MFFIYVKRLFVGFVRRKRTSSKIGKVEKTRRNLIFDTKNFRQHFFLTRLILFFGFSMDRIFDEVKIFDEKSVHI